MKRTVIDWHQRTEHHQISGSTFAIDRRLERRGTLIHLDRTYINHPVIVGIRTVLMPQEHLWALFFETHGQPPPYKCYIHMAQISDDHRTITVDDLYLDVIIRPNLTWQVLDIDEFRQALAQGELTTLQTQSALLGLERACGLVERSQGDLEGYLKRRLAGR
jgi:predicted RNA-binding protein associated with RNAse of E/G family